MDWFSPVLVEFDKTIMKYPSIKRFPGGASNDLIPNLQHPENPVPALDPTTCRRPSLVGATSRGSIVSPRAARKGRTTNMPRKPCSFGALGANALCSVQRITLADLR